MTSVSLLCGPHSRVLQQDASDDIEGRWTRAYIMEMFSCWLFLDSSSATVPACLLEWLRDLQNSLEINWGATVLACLYRGLCIMCWVDKPNLYGPIELLQHWSWMRFPFGHPRPRDIGWALAWGKPNGDLSVVCSEILREEDLCRDPARQTDNANLYSENHYFLLRKMAKKHMQSTHFFELFTANIFLSYFGMFWRKLRI